MINRKKKWPLMLTGLALLLAVSAWGLLALYAAQDTVPQSATAGEMSIGGLTIDQAIARLNKHWDDYENQQVQLQMNARQAHSSTTLAELGFRLERDEVVDAVLGLREGKLFERALYRYRYPLTLEVRLGWNRILFEQRVREQWNWLEYHTSSEAERIISEQGEVLFRPHTDAYRLDIEQLFVQVRQWATARLKDQQRTALISELPLAVLHPTITLQQLEEQGVDRLIASYTTDFSSSPEGRAYNVVSTAAILHDWLLAPDEVFEYSKVIQATEEHYGFREAPVILNGELVPGIGGGICQVSSTLYMAALLAGLEIEERRNHSLPVSYMPLGQDATFAEGYINFKIRNSTGKHLLIRTEVKDRKLTVNLFGTMPQEISYRIESNTVQVLQPTVREVPTDTVPSGGRVTLQNGKPGYVVETYRMKMRNGKQVSRERISRDTYKAQPTVVGISASAESKDASPRGPVGTTMSIMPDVSASSPIVEDGIVGIEQ